MFKRTLLFLALSICCNFASAFDWQTPEIPSRLWKISKSGQPDSYLLGTLHIGKPGSKLPEHIESLLKQSDLLLSEVITSPSPEVFKDILAMQQQMFDPKGKTLSSQIGRKRTALVKKHLQAHPESRHFIPYLEQMKPWAAVMFDIIIHPAGYSPKYGVDQLLGQTAAKHQIKHEGLEKYAELPQSFQKIPLARIIEQLDFSAKYHNEITSQQLQAIKLYQQKRYQEMFRLISDTSRYRRLNVPRNTLDYWQNWMEQDLLAARNTKWLPKLLNTLPHKKTLVAVGSAHLVDESGLIRQLRKHGYDVTPINE